MTLKDAKLKAGDARFEIFMAAKNQVEIFWIVMLCSVVVGHYCFGGLCGLHLQGKLNDAEKGGIDIRLRSSGL
jgi:hypothetical protein